MDPLTGVNRAQGREEFIRALLASKPTEEKIEEVARKVETILLDIGFQNTEVLPFDGFKHVGVCIQPEDGENPYEKNIKKVVDILKANGAVESSTCGLIDEEGLKKLVDDLRADGMEHPELLFLKLDGVDIYLLLNDVVEAAW